MEAFINILIIDEDLKNQRGLKSILSGNGNNLIAAHSIFEAIDILKVREIGIVIVNIDDPNNGGIEILQTLKEFESYQKIYKIALTKDSNAGANVVKGLHKGAVDYLTTPFNPNLVKAKIEVYKTLYFKDQEIDQLLNNIFPKTIVSEFYKNRKLKPKRVENGIILFTDFVDFSLKSKHLRPMELLEKLEYYFNKFDEICYRFNIEKIKTIGDSYMAIAGVTENLPHPAIRMCLAADEMRNLMLTDKEVSKAMNKDFWEIRIGIHAGPLVAGIIGRNKLSYDVWGDSVNIASRTEQNSLPGEITITEELKSQIEDYFEIEHKGPVAINKRGGEMHLHQLGKLKKEYQLTKNTSASRTLRELCGLNAMDFHQMKKDIENRLKSLLPENLIYHDVNHTKSVEKSAIQIAKLEGISEYETRLLRTAIWYHDSGFIAQYEHNEDFAVQMLRNNLPKFGYSTLEIDTIAKIVESTKHTVEPKTKLEMIMCDADLDYLGREDYWETSKSLRKEMENNKVYYTDLEWIDIQLTYLTEIHQYYTDTSRNLRESQKQQRINELQLMKREHENLH